MGPINHPILCFKSHLTNHARHLVDHLSTSSRPRPPGRDCHALAIRTTPSRRRHDLHRCTAVCFLRPLPSRRHHVGIGSSHPPRPQLGATKLHHLRSGPWRHCVGYMYPHGNMGCALFHGARVYARNRQRSLWQRRHCLQRRHGTTTPVTHLVASSHSDQSNVRRQVFGVVQMLVSAAAISFGFGKALELLTEAQIEKASKVGSQSPDGANQN